MATFRGGGTDRSRCQRTTRWRAAAHAIRAEKRAAAARPIGARPTLVAATVEGAVAGDTVRRADRRATGLTTLTRHSADGPRWQGATCRCATTDPIRAEQRAAATRPVSASAALVAAAIQRAISRDSIVGADGSAAGLTAIGGRSTDGARRQRTARRTAPADASRTQQTGATLGIASASTTLVTAAVQRTVVREPVVGTGNRPTSLIALFRRGADATEGNAPRLGTSPATDSANAQEWRAAISTAQVWIAGTTLVSTAIRRSIGGDTVARTDDGSAAGL